MDEVSFIDELIKKGKPAMIRLLEGRDIQAVPVAQDETAIIVKRNGTNEKSMIYKRAISVITPSGGSDG